MDIVIRSDMWLQVNHDKTCNGKLICVEIIHEQCNKCDNGMYPCGRNCWQTYNFYECNKCRYTNKKNGG